MDNTILFSIRLSFQVASVATFFIILFGVSIAYLLARRNFRGKEILDIILTLPLVLPPTVTGYYLILVCGRNGFIGKLIYQWTGWTIMFTWYAAVLASFVVAIPLMIKTARAAIESVDENLINASYTLGHSETETALKVILPLAKRGISDGRKNPFICTGNGGIRHLTLMIAGNIPGKDQYNADLNIFFSANSGDWNKAHIMVIFLTLLSGAVLYRVNPKGLRNH